LGHVQPDRPAGEGLSSTSTRSAKLPVGHPEREAETIVAELRAAGTAENRAGMARFGITGNTAGVSLADMNPITRRYARNHALAAALWRSGLHEACLMACDLDEPDKVTPKQMDEWAAAFDNWALCDGACLHLFVRTPFVDDKIWQWAEDEREFVRRAAFSLIAVYTVHGKAIPDKTFAGFLDLIARHATDQRNYVRKSVNWALRQIGKRSLALHGPALALARKLAASEDKSERWIGKDAVRELTDPKQLERLKARG
jgi:3-methyladenine DNA glycosylase AlkD